MEKETFSYDKTMQEIESIVTKIESGECKIDELVSEIKRATELIALCKKKLQSVDNDVKKAFEDCNQ